MSNNFVTSKLQNFTTPVNFSVHRYWSQTLQFWCGEIVHRYWSLKVFTWTDLTVNWYKFPSSTGASQSSSNHRKTYWKKNFVIMTYWPGSSGLWKQTVTFAACVKLEFGEIGACPRVQLLIKCGFYTFIRFTVIASCTNFYFYSRSIQEVFKRLKDFLFLSISFLGSAEDHLSFCAWWVTRPERYPHRSNGALKDHLCLLPK